MSVSVYVVAELRITEEDLEFVEIYNGLVAKGIEAPKEVIERLRERLGKDAFDVGEEVKLSEDLIEIPLEGRGDAMYEGGMTFSVKDFPPGTVSIRVNCS